MQSNIKQLHERIKSGNFYALAKGISIVENQLPGYDDLLLAVGNERAANIVGITGPPGAGKSTLVNALVKFWLKQGKKIAVLAVDPTSPFHHGALLGDRIRMTDLYTHPDVFIRSLATRGALGGLSARIIEISDLVREAPFDIIVVETVGVGQSEVEIAGLADCTVVALVPEAGDEVQTIKAGIMEIADIFVVNKADHEDAEGLYRNLRMMTHEKAAGGDEIAVIRTVATRDEGIGELAGAVVSCLTRSQSLPEEKMQLLTDKCWKLVQAERMKGLDHEALGRQLTAALARGDFNLYGFAKMVAARMQP